MASRSKTRKPKLDHPGVIAATLVDAKAKGKLGYKLSDAALQALIEKCRDADCPTCGALRLKNNGRVKSPDGRTFHIREIFAGATVMTNVGQNVRRFEVEEVSA